MVSTSETPCLTPAPPRQPAGFVGPPPAVPASAGRPGPAGVPPTALRRGRAGGPAADAMGEPAGRLPRRGPHAAGGVAGQDRRHGGTAGG